MLEWARLCIQNQPHAYTIAIFNDTTHFRSEKVIKMQQNQEYKKSVSWKQIATTKNGPCDLFDGSYDAIDMIYAD